MKRGFVMTYREMGILRPCAVLTLLCITFFPAAINADSWMLPTTQTYLSPDKTWRFTVTPRVIASPLAYFEDKVANRKNAGAIPGNLQKRAQGFMEHLDHGQWRAVWNEQLVNEVSPVSAIVSSTGWAVTFDNWHSMGYGEDVVVIYDDHGKPIRVMGLKDFLPEEYIKALPSSVSSLWWGDGHHFSSDGKQLVLRVAVPSDETLPKIDTSKGPHIELAFDLATGLAIPTRSEEWTSALAAARKVNADNRAAEAAWEAAFIAPLIGPRSDLDQDWHGYLIEAFFRLDPDWKDGFPATKVLRLPQRKDYQVSVGFLKDALNGKSGQDGALMIASPSQDNLVHVLTTLLASVPHSWLKNARVYVAVDDAHSEAVAKALSPTGAKYIQLDPDKPIPQREARLEAYRARTQ